MPDILNTGDIFKYTNNPGGYLYYMLIDKNLYPSAGEDVWRVVNIFKTEDKLNIDLKFDFLGERFSFLMATSDILGKGTKIGSLADWLVELS